MVRLSSYPEPTRPKTKSGRVRLKLRVSCTAPSKQAEKAWRDFLVRLLRKKLDQDNGTL